MKTWMTISDLSEYLQIPESKIRSFTRNKRIPFHDNRGFLRFHRPEIDEWMKSPLQDVSLERGGDGGDEDDADDTRDAMNMIREITYRGISMNDYTLTASIIFISVRAWKRVPDFIEKTIRAIHETQHREHGRNYLYREEFKPFINNYNDYLRVCCQLGLIDSKPGNGKRKFYYPTEYAEQMSEQPNRAKEIILESIRNIVGNKWETIPDERHSVLLLWYLLSLREQGIETDEKYFKLDKDKTNNYYPQIRFGFTSSLWEYLFDSNRTKEREFLVEWQNLI